MEAELAYRNSNRIPVGHLTENCRTTRDHRAWLEGVAQAQGVDIVSAVKTFGHLNVRQACREMGIEKAYLVDYSFESGHVHEQNLTTHSFMTVLGKAAQYEGGPTEEKTFESTFDVLRNFSLVAAAAAKLTEDEIAVADANRLQKELKDCRGGRPRRDLDSINRGEPQG
jgi:hypothetical protein